MYVPEEIEDANEFSFHPLRRLFYLPCWQLGAHSDETYLFVSLVLKTSFDSPAITASAG